MFNLEAISTENLRGLVHETPVALKPITLLVGRNSAGKSTFARIFPLLRQSVDSLRRSPILWFGRTVDFGTFSDVCNRARPEGPIKFRFFLRSNGEKKVSLPYWDTANRAWIDSTQQIEVELSIRKDADSDSSFASAIELRVAGIKANIEYDRGGFIQLLRCGQFEWKPSDGQMAYSATGRLVPTVTALRRVKTEGNTGYFSEDGGIFLGYLRDVFVRNVVHGNTQDDKIASLAKDLTIGDPARLYSELIDGLTSRGLTHHLDSLDRAGGALRRISEAILVFRLPDLLDALESSIARYFSGVRYLAPLRATAHRYYRTQELAVDEIDPEGQNLASVISSLRPHERTSLDQWTREHLGFSVEATSTAGHVTIGIRPKGSREATNLADMGFGFSQVLPIPVQLWLSQRELRSFPGSAARKRTTCIVVEQPELHLHPDMQARLANLFAGVASLEGDIRPPELIIETHSPALINRFGELVHKGKLARESIQVLVFEPSVQLRETKIRVADFDAEGALRNWPIGFFQPDYD
jgi:hypothetical protein